METTKLRKFAVFARKSLIEQVQVKLDAVLAEASTARRENEKVVKELEEQVAALGKEQLVERVAYTWFNRFCALRYMDVNRYTRIGILSPEPGRFQPEILAEAKMGHIDEDLIPEPIRSKIAGLLDGSLPSHDPHSEAYRLLFVAACNHYHHVMPFLFEKISDYTELLLPDDLLSGNSILAYTREALLPANCSPEYTDESVEAIGWLYQFYISEKKDEVFAALKEGKKISPENIPAATQLFTPHWIVRYLVENSLGRLWMLNHPESKLVERMDYYIRPEAPETEFLRISSPEEIKICDPACGSGHMLTYAFDLLYAIYEEQGYQAIDIPRLILQNNLYGIEIDRRAGALAAFALTMKARERDNRFFRRTSASGEPVEPNICVLENIFVEPGDLSAYMDKVGRDVFSGDLQGVIDQFEEADNFGSLIRPLVTDVSDVLETLRGRQMYDDIFLASVHQKVLKALRQADYLSPKYHVAVANPPYMGGNGMNVEMRKFATSKYADTKADLFAMFSERICEMCSSGGFVGLMTPFTWMFLSSHEHLRRMFLNSKTLTSLVRPEYHAFFESAFVPLCAFTLFARHLPDYRGTFIDLNRFYGADLQAGKAIQAIRDSSCSWRFSASARKLLRIPGAPIAYWASENEIACFSGAYIADVLDIKSGLLTGNDEVFLRLWWEVSFSEIPFDLNHEDEIAQRNPKWLPVTGGGEFRKWFGNLSSVVNSRDEFSEIRHRKGNNFRLRDPALYFRKGINWPMISSSYYGAKLSPENIVLGNGVRTGFLHTDTKTTEEFVISYLSSCVANSFLEIINPTLNFNNENVAVIPFNYAWDPTVHENGILAISLSQADWNSQEIAWDFKSLPVLSDTHAKSLKSRFEQLSSDWKAKVDRLRDLEEENNNIFALKYGLSAELVERIRPQLQDITLVCNPANRFDSDKNEPELAALLLADTMREFISYAVGCMFGRYSLDKPGLILANQGETAEDHRRQIPEPTFPPDEDNVIPLLDGDWFPDDISERFKTFLKISFGTEHYEENLTFLENALYPENLQGKRRKTVRDYFLKEFYDHHIKMYKRRPIYWLFSSPKGTFNALIYMHRYRPDTVSVVLNEYLREFHAKLTAKVDHLQTVANSGAASATDKAKALKEITKLKKDLKELTDYEHNVLYPLATRQVEIDLDDGVKVNYNKFGKALKKVTGLSE